MNVASPIFPNSPTKFATTTEKFVIYNNKHYDNIYSNKNEHDHKKTSMIQAERRNLIADFVRKTGKISIEEIVERFNVSEMTARRDLQHLDKEGFLRRVHGGAVNAAGRSYEPPYQVRSLEMTEAKIAIGKKAAEQIEDGDSIALDVGTTTLEIARALKGRHGITVITASLPIAIELMSNNSLRSDIRLILTGGIVRPGEFSLIGSLAESAYKEFHVDKAFVGVGGVSHEDGLTEYNLEDTQVKRTMIKSAHKVILVADHSKFNKTTFANIAPLSSVDTVVTDNQTPEAALEKLRESGIQVVVAD